MSRPAYQPRSAASSASSGKSGLFSSMEWVSRVFMITSLDAFR
ncbi:hypothetical protein DM50_3542 [Burkholderia mallei]|nr:hypothetical protein DM50_3542 [Burkholderia mallei]